MMWDVTVGQGLAFVPNTLNITEGDTVCWNWASNGHSVTSGINCMASGWFCSPDNINCSQGSLSNTGTQYCVTFNGGWVYYHFFAAHCTMGMTGVITVSPKPRRPGCPWAGWVQVANGPSSFNESSRTLVLTSAKNVSTSMTRLE